MTDIESYDAVLVLVKTLRKRHHVSRCQYVKRQKRRPENGSAALQTQPWLAEPVERIAQDALGPVYVIDVTQTKLEDISKVSVVATPEDITKLGFKVAADEIATICRRFVKSHDHAQNAMSKARCQY